MNMPQAVALVAAATAASAAAGAAPLLHDALLGLPFANTDTVHAATSFAMRPVGSIYLECEAPTKARWAWADGRITPFHQHTYLYARNDSAWSPESPYNNSMLGGWSVPASGMRSAPPLGGLAAGSVELRGDGSLRAWTIENASPAGSTKLDQLDDATFGVLAGGAAKLLRTHPPAGLEGQGVRSIQFSGSQPFTRLVPADAALPAPMQLKLFGRSRWRVGDMAASATPAAAFTLTATNPSASEHLNVSLFFALPFSLQHGILRDGNSGAVANASAGAAESCRAACAANVSCAAWSVGPTCAQHPDSAVPNARNAPAGVSGVASGISGSWAKGAAHNCATLHRKGTHHAAGDVSLCAAAESAATSVSFASGPDTSSLWEQFSSGGGGRLDGSTLGDHAVGAAAVTMTLPPGANGSATVALGWYFPHRDFMGETVGNHYVDLVAGSEEAALLLLPPAAAPAGPAPGPAPPSGNVAAAVADVRDWGKFASALTSSPTMPGWLGDSLLNSLHHYRSAMWLRDGRWRQWESFSCVNVDSVHNDGERHLACTCMATLFVLRPFGHGPQAAHPSGRAWRTRCRVAADSHGQMYQRAPPPMPGGFFSGGRRKGACRIFTVHTHQTLPAVRVRFCCLQLRVLQT